MKNKIIFLICLMVLSGAIIFLPKNVSAHSGFKCWATPVTYDNGATTYSFKVCGYTKSGHGNELVAAVSNPLLLYLLLSSPAPCGNVTVQLLSATSDIVNTPPVVVSPPVAPPVSIPPTVTPVTPAVPPCVPTYSCDNGKVINSCDKSFIKNCTLYGLICSNSGGCTNAGGVTIDPLTQNADGTTKGNIIISTLKIGPNTINAYDPNNPTTTGKCNIQWSLSQYDSNSTCTITGGHLSGTSFVPTSLSGVTPDTKITNETTYKLTCGENVTDTNGVTSLTSVSTKYATCNVNASYNEVNR